MTLNKFILAEKLPKYNTFAQYFKNMLRLGKIIYILCKKLFSVHIIKLDRYFL